MSRKTRKLMWSVPLIAAVAVIGALAAFVVLSPNGAAAHDEGPDIAAHQPPPPVTGIDVTTPSIANGGRSSLQVSWDAPVTTGANTPTMYRVDISTDTDVWMNVIGGEGTNTTLTEGMATSNCTSSDEGNRCHTATDLKADTLYHFRVFAMNQHGTSPISVNYTIGSGMTLRIDPPAKATGLEATDYHEDKIVVSWDEVTVTGGADVLWYCVGVASSPSGPFEDLTLAVNMPDCLDATAEADVDAAGVTALLGLQGGVNYASQTAVVAATNEDGDPVMSWTHDGLGGGDHDGNASNTDVAHEVELRYRLYAVTDQDGKADTPDDRKIARAASEVATGRTVRPDGEPDPRFEAPKAVGNLRAVAYTTQLDPDDSDPLTPRVIADPIATNQGLHFFWTHPDGYNPDYNGDDALTDPNWYVQVQRRVAADADHDDYTGWQFVTGESILAALTPLAPDYGTPQFTVDFEAELNLALTTPTYAAPVLWGDSKDDRHTYRVRYVNPGKDDEPVTKDVHQNTDLTDDVVGDWRQITILQVTHNHFRNADEPDDTSTLPIILRSAADNAAPNLRFEYNDDSARDARDHINLFWTRNENARDDQDGPNGYVIDRSADGGVTWQSLDRADTPTELGTADTFTDSHKVVPGHKYTYRVFPVFIEGTDAYGIPALIHANSRGADLPGAARSVDADGDGQNACLVTWTAPADPGGQPVRGYLIQIAPDEDGSPGAWATINIVDGTPPFTVMGGDTTEFKYTGTAAQVSTVGAGADVDTLTAGSVRWFRVIPVTNENDGDRATGGAALDEQGGANEPVNPTDAASVGDLPLEDDRTRADPAKCTTDGLGDAPADQVTADPQKPVDLTAEAAADTNSQATSDRGVFLTWNMQLQGDASETTSYRINRIRMNTGVDALDDDADDWQYLTRVSDVTSYTDSTDLRRVEETRMYQVCSEASGVAEPACVDMAVDYGLHPEMHEPLPVFSAPSNVAATSTGGTITVMWTPGDLAASQIAIVVNAADDTDYCVSVPLLAGDASTYECTGLTVGQSYVVLLIALDGQGGYMLGNVGMIDARRPVAQSKDRNQLPAGGTRPQPVAGKRQSQSHKEILRQ